MPNPERLFKGATLTLTREAGGAPIAIGQVFDVQENGKPATKIPIGDWGDTRVMTRPGRVQFSDWTLGIRFNPDDVGQKALYTCKGTGENCTFILVAGEGTLKTKTFHGRVGNWGFAGKQEDIYQGTLNLIGTDIQVRS